MTNEFKGRTRTEIERNLPEDYIFDDFAEEIAEKLCDKYPNEFGHLDLDRVAFLRKNVKAKAGRKRKFASCMAIPVPAASFSPVSWIIVTNGENFTTLPLDKKQKVIYHELIHIPDTMEEGKVVKHNIEDFKSCLDKFGGPNWVDNGSDELLVSMEDEKDNPLNQGPDEFDS